jgi:hypothetical protein
MTEQQREQQRAQEDLAAARHPVVLYVDSRELEHWPEATTTRPGWDHPAADPPGDVRRFVAAIRAREGKPLEGMPP